MQIPNIANSKTTSYNKFKIPKQQTKSKPKIHKSSKISSYTNPKHLNSHKLQNLKHQKTSLRTPITSKHKSTANNTSNQTPAKPKRQHTNKSKAIPVHPIPNHQNNQTNQSNQINKKVNPTP